MKFFFYKHKKGKKRKIETKISYHFRIKNKTKILHYFHIGDGTRTRIRKIFTATIEKMIKVFNPYLFYYHL